MDYLKTCPRIYLGLSDAQTQLLLSKITTGFTCALNHSESNSDRPEEAYVLLTEKMNSP